MGKFADFFAKVKKPSLPENNPASYIDITPGAVDKAKPPAVQRETWFSRWRPGSKRDRQIAWLQAGYSETLDLMRSIRQHLDRQEDIQVKMANVLDRLPESMDGLKSVNKAAEQQVVVLGLLRQQIEANVHHDQKLVESMDNFNQTLGLMDETSRNSGRTVTDLIEKAKNSEALLREVIERSERRFVYMTTLFVVVIVAAAAAFYFFGTGVQGVRRAEKITAPAYSLPVNAAPSPSAGNQAAIEEVSISEAPAVNPISSSEDHPKTLFQRMFHRKGKIESDDKPAAP
jgi:hypothetical protein